MKNAHQRFGVLEYTKRTKDTTTRVRLRMDHFIGEIERQGDGRAHLLSVLGGDSDVGAVWAGINEHSVFTVEVTESDPITVSLGEGAQCFRGTIAVPGRKPIRQLVAVSADVANTRPGADPEGKRTVLCDDGPTFIFYRMAQRFGLPVVPDWASWFKEELRRHEALQSLVGLGCSPVVVTGTKKMFLKWIGRALRQKRIRFPDCNGPVHWSVAHEFFGSGPTATEQPSGTDGLKTAPQTPGEEES